MKKIKEHSTALTGDIDAMAISLIAKKLKGKK